VSSSYGYRQSLRLTAGLVSAILPPLAIRCGGQAGHLTRLLKPNTIYKKHFNETLQQQMLINEPTKISLSSQPAVNRLLVIGYLSEVRTGCKRTENPSIMQKLKFTKSQIVFYYSLLPRQNKK